MWRKVGNLTAGDPVIVEGSREGGREISYRGTVRRILPSGTVLIDDRDNVDGAGTPTLHYCANGSISLDRDWIANRLEEIRAALRAEEISYSELADLTELAPYIASGDAELLEAAGVPEEQARDEGRI